MGSASGLSARVLRNSNRRSFVRGFCRGPREFVKWENSYTPEEWWRGPWKDFWRASGSPSAKKILGKIWKLRSADTVVTQQTPMSLQPSRDQPRPKTADALRGLLVISPKGQVQF